MKCKNCTIEFEITDLDRKFYNKIEVPEPTLCPDCREQRRLVFNNERKYYKRKCDLCSKDMVSVYDPERIKNVYCYKCWWGDGWDPSDYGRDFDFSKDFNSQYRQLLEEVPKLTMMNDNGAQSVNCEYTYNFAFGKNAYMVVATWYTEDSMYTYGSNYTKDIVDNITVNHSELMYECVVCEESYGCQHCYQCKGCRDCTFGYDLHGCHDCICCSSLRNAEYCIWNKQYSKDDYEKERSKMQLDSWKKREEYKKKFAEFIISTPRKYAHLIKCQDSTGDNLIRCKGSKNCFNTADLQDCKHMAYGDKGKDSYDCNISGNPELCYDSITPDDSYHTLFTVYCWKSQFVAYSDNCHSSNNLFGCVGMKKGQYSILNKKYDEESYKELKKKIINHMKKTGEWGEFFRPGVSLFKYNETVADEWHPIEKEKALELGYGWADKLPELVGKGTIDMDKLPDSIDDIDDSICKEVLTCTSCSKNYKVIKGEFEIYKRLGTPIPRYCVDCRYLARKGLLNEKKLYHRQCMNEKCTNEFETTYASDRPEKVLCEKCYRKEIY